MSVPRAESPWPTSIASPVHLHLTLPIDLRRIAVASMIFDVSQSACRAPMQFLRPGGLPCELWNPISLPVISLPIRYTLPLYFWQGFLLMKKGFNPCCPAEDGKNVRGLVGMGRRYWELPLWLFPRSPEGPYHKPGNWEEA